MRVKAIRYLLDKHSSYKRISIFSKIIGVLYT